MMTPRSASLPALFLVFLINAVSPAQEPGPAQESAQEPPQEIEIPPDLGFLRIVNATGHPGRLWVKVNGVKLAASTGYEDGTATGAMGIAQGTLQVEMRHDSLEEVKLSVALKTGQVTTLIAAPERKKKAEPAAEDEAEETPKLAAHLLELPATGPEDEPTLSLIQFTSAAQLTVTVAGITCALEPAAPQTIAITPAMGGFLDVLFGDKTVAQLNFKDPAGQGVVFYTDAKNTLKSAQFRNDVQ